MRPIRLIPITIVFLYKIMPMPEMPPEVIRNNFAGVEESEVISFLSSHLEWTLSIGDRKKIFKQMVFF